LPGLFSFTLTSITVIILKLFDFFAASVEEFMDEAKMDKTQTYPMGFTFSFPVKQTSLNSGELFEWTKGFSADGVKGQDVVALLNKAFLKRVCALLLF